jgi:hypothetical protein
MSQNEMCAAKYQLVNSRFLINNQFMCEVCYIKKYAFGELGVESMPVIPTTMETEVRGSWSESSPGQRYKTLPEKQTKA